MADEILKRDENHIPVLGAVTDNAAQEIRMLRVDPTTGKLLISLTGVGVSATIDVGTTDTIASGLPATATNVGTTSAAIVDFEIPKGSTIYSTILIPNNAIGMDGDWAISTAVTSEVFYKSSGAWALVNSIRGATGPTGATGPAGAVGMTWKGTYGAGTPYVVNDAVYYNGTSYISIQNGTGQTPNPAGTAYWSVLALKGTDGAGSGDFMANGTVPMTGSLQMGQQLATNVGGLQFDLTPATTPIEGSLTWNADEETLDLGQKNGVVLQVGQEMNMKVKNNTVSNILNGKAVYVNGRDGMTETVALARADVLSTSRVLGVTTEQINAGNTGKVTTMGLVHDIKTDYNGAGIWGTTWATNDLLYLSSTDAGVLTNVQPASPNFSDKIGKVGIVDSTTGTIDIGIERHLKLTDLSDVDGTPLTADGQIPVWHNTAGYFDFDKNINNYATTAVAATKQYYHGVVARPVGASNPLPQNLTTPIFTLGATANPISYYYQGTPLTVSADLKAVLDDATGATTTSGVLVSGKHYTIVTFVAGDNFSNIATVLDGTINTTGCTFTATGTTPTNWTHGSSVRELVSSSGLYYAYFVDSLAQVKVTKLFPGISNISNVIIANINWNGTDYGLIGDERHAYTRNCDWHEWAHDTIGCRYQNGLTYTNNGGTGAAATFSVTAGVIHDEDIDFAVPASSAFPTANTCRIFWQTAANTYVFDKTTRTTPGYLGAGNKPNYVSLPSYTLTQMTSANNRWINVWIYATTGLHTPIYMVTETVTATVAADNGYRSLALARAIPFPNLANSGFSPELKPIYRQIWRADGLCEAIDPNLDDYRAVSSLPFGAGTSATSAGAVTFVPYGNVGAGNVQSAIQELDDEKLGVTRVAVSTAVMTEQAIGFTLEGGTTKKTLTVPLDASVSGTNTGDQTNISGNAATVTVVDASGDSTTWPMLAGTATGSIAPLTDAGLSYDASTNILTATGGFAGTLPLAGGTMTGKVVSAGRSEVAKTYTPATGSQTVALDASVNNMHVVTGHADGTAITFTITGMTDSQPIIVMIKQGSGTVSTIASWFSGISWCGGSAPTLTATLSKTDTFGFIRTGSSTYTGYVIGQNA